MGQISLFNILAKGTETVLDVADKVIDFVGVPLTFLWGGLNSAIYLAHGLGASQSVALIGGGIGGLAIAGLTYYGSHALTGLFRGSAENTAPAQPERSRADFSFGGLAPA